MTEMIQELRTYTLVPGKQADYLRLSGEVSRKIRGDNYGKLEGYWTTEFGTLNQVVHLWTYADLGERDRLRAALGANELWVKEFLPQSRPLLVKQETKILRPVVALQPPADTGHLYELRTYRVKPGTAPEWLRHFVDAMPVRQTLSRYVGIWQTEIPGVNEVVHLWAYRDLGERASVRARAVGHPGWQAFLEKATPLIEEMQSVVLVPAPFSPLR